MTAPHFSNIVIHVIAGSAALLLGLILLMINKGTDLHVKIGRIFIAFAVVVCTSALVGTILFRFIPLFAVLTLLVSYLVLGGWRATVTKDSGPSVTDSALTASALLGTAILLPILLKADLSQGSSAPVIFSTLGAVIVVIVYDIAKWFFPRGWHARLWRFEHIYKVLSAFFGMASAAIGNIFHTTLAQLLPSVIGTLVIAWFFWREFQRIKPSHSILAHVEK
jgi:uncharacterized membrane protein